jgi:hypothetical protein
MGPIYIEGISTVNGPRRPGGVGAAIVVRIVSA